MFPLGIWDLVSSVSIWQSWCLSCGVSMIIARRETPLVTFGTGLFWREMSGRLIVRQLQLQPHVFPTLSTILLTTRLTNSQVVTRLGNFSSISVVWDLVCSMGYFQRHTTSTTANWSLAFGPRVQVALLSTEDWMSPLHSPMCPFPHSSCSWSCLHRTSLPFGSVYNGVHHWCFWLTHQTTIKSICKSYQTGQKRIVEVNSTTAMWPIFKWVQNDTTGSINLGEGYNLLWPKDTKLYTPSPAEQNAITAFYSDLLGTIDALRSIYQWARLRIPTGQTAQSYSLGARGQLPSGFMLSTWWVLKQFTHILPSG